MTKYISWTQTCKMSSRCIDKQKNKDSFYLKQFSMESLSMFPFQKEGGGWGGRGKLGRRGSHSINMESFKMYWSHDFNFKKYLPTNTISKMKALLWIIINIPFEAKQMSSMLLSDTFMEATCASVATAIATFFLLPLSMFFCNSLEFSLLV